LKRRKLRDNRGQATVEFALILPVVLMLVVGVIEFAKAFNYWINLNHLANEGARWAAVNKLPPYQDCTPPGNTVPAQPFPSAAQLQHYMLCQASTAQEEAAIQGAGGSFSVCTVPSGAGTTESVGDPVRVKIVAPYSFPLTSGFVRFFVNNASVGSVKLTGTSTQRLEVPNLGAVNTGWGTTCP
jgi:Flp pilus assembly protein TadG